MEDYELTGSLSADSEFQGWTGVERCRADTILPDVDRDSRTERLMLLIEFYFLLRSPSPEPPQGHGWHRTVLVEKIDRHPPLSPGHSPSLASRPVHTLPQMTISMLKPPLLLKLASTHITVPPSPHQPIACNEKKKKIKETSRGYHTHMLSPNRPAEPSTRRKHKPRFPTRHTNMNKTIREPPNHFQNIPPS